MAIVDNVARELSLVQRQISNISNNGNVNNQNVDNEHNSNSNVNSPHNANQNVNNLLVDPANNSQNPLDNAIG